MRVLAGISFSHFLNDTMQSLIASVYPILKDAYALDYAQIGTLSGNPPGIIPAIEFVGDYTVVTKVTYVDDPAAGGCLQVGRPRHEGRQAAR